MEANQKIRTIIFYKEYFADFFVKQRQKVKDKIIWTFDLIELIEKVPETYLKHLEGTDKLFEIRVQNGSDIFRIFCFFDEGNLVVLANGFQKKTQKTPKQEIEKALKLESNIMKANKNIKTLSEFKDEHYGKIGSARRDKLDKGFEAFKLGALIQEARLEKGLTQEQLADRCGTNKAYISKVENNIKDVRISTLQKIVELGFGGQLNVSIKL